MADTPSLWARRLTAAGTAAIAVFRIEPATGTSADTLWQFHCQYTRRPNDKPWPTQTPQLRSGVAILQAPFPDEMTYVFALGHGDTGTPYLEWHTHGGRRIQEQVWQFLLQQGVQPYPEANDWAAVYQPSPAGPNARLAWQLLPQALTERTAAILLDQANGAYENSPERWAEWEKYRPLGRHLVTPFTVVLAGVPNAGKSSLMNALAGYERSIVAAVPGTTRDLIEATLAFAGWPVRLVDTAGLRQTSNDIEAQGISRAQAAMAEADLVLLLIEAEDGQKPEPSELEAIRDCPVLIVRTKFDLHTGWQAAESEWPVSAVTGFGLQGLIEAIVQQLVPNVPHAGDGVPLTTTHSG